MIRMKVWSILAAAFVLSALGAPALHADVFQLNVDYCTFGCITPALSSGGTVTVTGSGTVTVAVDLADYLAFHDQGLSSFSFNIAGAGAPIITSANVAVTNNGGSTWVFETPGTGNADGAGNFMYSFMCTAGAGACTGLPNVFTFTVTAAGLTTAMFETTNGGASHVDFAANVAIKALSGCTGVIGGGLGTGQSTPAGSGGAGTNCGTTPPVPEPATLGLFGTGLVLLGGWFRRRLRARS